MSRNVNIEECLANGAIVAGLTRHEAELFFKGFASAAYPPKKRRYAEYGPRDPETGRKPLVSKGYKTHKNGYATQCFNEAQRLFIKEWEKDI